MLVSRVLNSMSEMHKWFNHTIHVLETAKVVYGEAGAGYVSDREREWIAHVVKNRHLLRNKYHFGDIRKDFKGYKRFEEKWKEDKPPIDPYNAEAVNKLLRLSSYPLEAVKLPKGHKFIHVFYRIKEKR